MMAPHWQECQLAYFGNGLPGLVDEGGEITTQDQSRGDAVSIRRWHLRLGNSRIDAPTFRLHPEHNLFGASKFTWLGPVSGVGLRLP